MKDELTAKGGSSEGGKATGFFASADKIAALKAAAESWKGTPFCPNGAVKGAGVSCQKLVGRLYAEAGFMPGEFAPPDGPMDWGAAHSEVESLIVAYVSEKVAEGLLAEMPITGPFAAGDLVGFRMGGCVQHLGVMVDSLRFVHCFRNTGVIFNRIDDASFSRRLVKVWRPLNSEEGKGGKKD